jgi:hypothetical protein
MVVNAVHVMVAVGILLENEYKKLVNGKNGDTR